MVDYPDPAGQEEAVQEVADARQDAHDRRAASGLQKLSRGYPQERGLNSEER